MLVVTRLGEAAARYYATDPTGAWWGAGCAPLGLVGRVDPDDLDAVLRGRRPGGEPLPLHRSPHRRGGWDLVLAAPKSVSLLAAVAETSGPVVAAAHDRAVVEALDWLQDQACFARRRGGRVAGEGMVAAFFSHRFSAGGDPHLHTHVLLANVVRTPDGVWSALDATPIWLERKALGAVYHLGLRQHLLAGGLRPVWDLHPDGTADVAGVPRAAVEAASRRRRQIQARLLEAPTEATARARRTIMATTRVGAPSAGQWREAVAGAGFGAAQAAALESEASASARRAAAGPVPTRTGERPTTADIQLAGAVLDCLAARRSTFGPGDVMAALAAVHADGATAKEAHRWATALCAASPPAPEGRWTSLVAARQDRSLVAAAAASRSSGVARATPPAVAAALARRPGLGPATVEAVRHLTLSGDGVELLATGAGQPEGFVQQAAAIDAAREAWEATGQTVALLTTSALAARRWQVLTGLATDTSRPAVLVVDRADRRPTPELTAIIQEARGGGTKVVLVLGGTLPPRRRALSEAVEQAARLIGRDVCSTTFLPGREQLGPDPTTTLEDAVKSLVRRWETERWGKRPPMLVGLGPAEVQELNKRARAVLLRSGALPGDAICLAGREYAVGDVVVALRRAGGPVGRLGQVTVLHREARTMDVDWGAMTQTVGGWQARWVGHGYAVTPALLKAVPGPVLALGDPRDLGPHREQVMASVGVGPLLSVGRSRREPALGLGGP